MSAGAAAHAKDKPGKDLPPSAFTQLLVGCWSEGLSSSLAVGWRTSPSSLLCGSLHEVGHNMAVTSSE